MLVWVMPLLSNIDAIILVWISHGYLGFNSNYLKVLISPLDLSPVLLRISLFTAASLPVLRACISGDCMSGL